MISDVPSAQHRTRTWEAHRRVYAAVYDAESGVLAWHDDVGSMCGFDGGAHEQSAETFLRQGAPVPSVPDEALEAIRQHVREHTNPSSQAP